MEFAALWTFVFDLRLEDDPEHRALEAFFPIGVGKNRAGIEKMRLYPCAIIHATTGPVCSLEYAH